MNVFAQAFQRHNDKLLVNAFTRRQHYFVGCKVEKLFLANPLVFFHFT